MNHKHYRRMMADSVSEIQQSAKEIVKSESDLVKARPKQIKLMEGKNKGRVVNVVRDNPGSSNMGIKAVGGSENLIVNSTNRGHHTASENRTAGWDRNRKHKVVTEGSSTPSIIVNNHERQNPTETNWDDDERSFTPPKGILSSKHAHPAIPHTANQKALMHGVDLSKAQQMDTGWTSEMTLSGIGSNHKKKPVIVKGHLDHEHAEIGNQYSHQKKGALSSAQREALYHNMAHNVFGMGKYVPATAVAEHKGSHYSVMEKIPKAEHYDKSPKHDAILSKMKSNGDIQKLAIMNVILGNSDRHGGNYMISPKGMHLIDHGLTFNYHDNFRDIYKRPQYLEHAYGSSRDSMAMDLHPETAKWLKGLDTVKIEKYLDSHKMDKRFKASIMDAISLAKQHAGKRSLDEVVSPVYNYHNDNKWD